VTNPSIPSLNEPISAFSRWLGQFPLSSGVECVEFTCPDGGIETRPAFRHQPASFAYDVHGYETVTPSGEVALQARFTPERPGRYHYRALCGQTAIAEGAFDCAPSHHPGFVQVSTRDPRYFACTDGSSFCPIGLNLVGPSAYHLPQGGQHFITKDETATLGVNEYRRWFRLLAENGGNFTRLWLSHGYFNIEGKIAADIDLLALARLDAVVEAAREYGVRLKLCFEHFRTFEPGASWALKVLQHPRSGESPKDMDAWFTSPDWRELWLQKIGAYLARYGNDPIVMAWELWNEINACLTSRWEIGRDWTREMLRHILPLVPKQMVVNSLGSFDAPESLTPYRDFCMDEMPFQQVHRYLDQGAPWEICHVDPVAFSLDAIQRTRRPDKPVILAETGAVNDCHTGPFRYYRMDNRGVIFHDTTYPAFFAGAAGTGQAWFWAEYVDFKNLWGNFKPFADLVAGIQLDAENFQLLDLSCENTWILGLKGNQHLLLWLRNKADRWDHVLRDELETPLIEPIKLPLAALGEYAGSVQLLSPFQEPLGNAVLTDRQLTLPAFRYALLVRMG
jgi:hypothetical protein